MRNRRIISSPTTCARHSERPAAGRCDDCSEPLCQSCQIEIADIGTFCWDCASLRGGLHVGRRHTYVESEEQPRPVERLESIDPIYAGLGVQVFEAMVGDREPRSLISGLTEALVEAGADPTDVVDDDEINEDVSRLQAIAMADPVRSRRMHRG